MTIWRTRIACWIPKSTNTHSEYVILIAFPLHHLLHERISMLCYTYVHGLSRSHYDLYIFYCTRYLDTYRSKIIHEVKRILIYSSFCARNVILLTSRPNFVEVVHTIGNVEEVWIKVNQDHSTNKNPKLINRSYKFLNCVSWRAKVMSLTQITEVWGSLGAEK
jgi:hypothetical protein